jgi:hypothetical protein
MATRADPERIHLARRIAIRNSLARAGMPLVEAERWCTAWEIEAATRRMSHDGDFWTVGSAWIAEQRAARRGDLA